MWHTFMVCAIICIYMQGAAQGTRQEEQLKLAQLTGKAAATIAILQVHTEQLLYSLYCFAITSDSSPLQRQEPPCL
jgi:hypothetical protein